MKCELFEELIPLYVGGDLEPSEADDLRQHLTSCAQCRQLHEAFQASQTWLATFAKPEFDEASLATLRASVLNEIERQEKRGSWLNWLTGLLPNWNPRLVLAVSTAALVAVTALSVAVFRNQIATPEPGSGDTVAITEIGGSTNGGDIKPAVHNNQAGAKIGQNRITKQRASTLLPEEAFNNGGFSNALEPPVIPEESAPEAVGAVEPEEKDHTEMLRIELQTADPNIRIIWLTPKADSPSNPKTK